MDARAAQEQSIVEILATWGATARPEIADLFAVLVESGGHESLDLLVRLLASPAVTGNAELKRELGELAESARGGGDANGADFAVRLGETLARCSAAIKPGIDDLRGRFEQELLPWSPLIPRERLDPLLAGLWRSERVDSADDQLAGLDALDEARARLAEARKDAEQELRSALESEIPPETRTLVDRALESGDPVSMASARESLQGKVKQDAASGRAEEMATARQALLALVEQAQGSLATGKLDGRSNGLLGAAVEGARAALDGNGDSPDALGFWQAALRTMTGGGVAEPAGDAERAELARGIMQECRKRSGEAGSAIDGLERGLVEAGSLGDAPFFEKLLEVFESVRAVDDRSTQRAGESLPALREAAACLTALLEKSAATLPTERVVDARAMLDDVDVKSAAADPEQIESLSRSIDESVDELKELAAKIHRSRQSEAAAGQEQLADEIRALMPVADAATRRQLKTLGSQVDGASPKELRAATTRLDALRSEIEGGIRLSAALVLTKCEKKKQNGESKSQIDALRAALADDDLVGASRLTGKLAESVGGVPRPSGPLPTIVLAVLILVVPLGGLFGWKMISGGPKTYHVVLQGEAVSSATTVSLIRDGEVVERLDYDPGQGASFDLSPGSYEIFVNGRYTGRVIQAPGDPATVDGVPAPTE